MLQALVAVLAANFRDFGPAAEMIQTGDFAITDMATGRDIDLERKWDVLLRPGQAVAMSLVFRREGGRQDATCPSCRFECPEATGSDIQWCATRSKLQIPGTGHVLTLSSPNCGSVFRRILDLTETEDSKSKARVVFDNYARDADLTDTPETRSKLAVLMAPTAAAPVAVDSQAEQDRVDDAISMFRNVRIISNPSRRRSPRVWCDIQARSWWFNDYDREERAGWCYVENVRIPSVSSSFSIALLGQGTQAHGGFRMTSSWSSLPRIPTWCSSPANSR